MLVHTGKFYCTVKEEEIPTVSRNLNENTNALSTKIDVHFPGITTLLKEGSYDWTLFIYVDFIKLLGKADITGDDSEKATEKINHFIKFVFGNTPKEPVLTRLDYRFDTIVKDKSQRELLLKLYRKTYDTHGFKKKYDRYDSSLYFNSKSINIIVYDKEEERNAKQQEVEDYERDVLRFEVRLLNPHINYMKRKNGLVKILSNYMDEDFWKTYLKKNLSPFFFAGSFRKINIAEKLIKSSELKPTEQENLRQFLCDVSIYGFDNILKFKKTSSTGDAKTKYTKYLMKKYLKWLKELDINPLLIPKNFKVDLGPEKKIENPLADVFLFS
ncbi:hypothetical protein ON064_03070 [Planococcus sp. A6]|uniref:phage/plasmid replication domain-containing protein n=1 Tax=Planococcus sp. A6 TaxID=2992760 RepID=UPI00237BF9B2|nr:phage/plasmid replication protein [Planococcus sp. A6]MDE0582026.1 hypothetical protein [Planococcus sp. A6]